jgi:hypothetical protein
MWEYTIPNFQFPKEIDAALKPNCLSRCVFQVYRLYNLHFTTLVTPFCNKLVFCFVLLQSVYQNFAVSGMSFYLIYEYKKLPANFKYKRITE